MVEFALVLPVLLIILFGIVDFGLYFYNDLQLTQAARDAARYASVNNPAGVTSTIADATGRLVSTALADPEIDYGEQGDQATVILTGTYTFLSPLPGLLLSLFGTELSDSIGIDATAIMRRE